MLESLLAKIPLFSSLEPSELESFAKAANPVTLPANAILFYEGDHSDSLYVILEGEVEIIKEINTPEEHLLRVFKPGEYFGEMGFFTPREARAATVRARTRVNLLQFGRKDFDRLICHPAVAVVLVRELSSRLLDSEKTLTRLLKTTHLQVKKHLKEKRETEQLALIGQSISNLVHEIKNPLISIGGFTRLVCRNLQEDSPDHKRLEIVLKETERLDNLAKSMLDLARPLEPNRSCQDITPLVTEVASMVVPIAEQKEVRIESRLAAGLPPVAFDFALMKQVLLNLLLNAVQASPQAEMVVISCRRLGDSLAIDVIDHGPGVPVENREKIFTPFFTTKKEGTGLGLPIVRKIVEAHAGTIQIKDSTKGETIFSIEIPGFAVNGD